MSEPIIKQVQEQIIEMDGTQYRIVDVSNEIPPKHQCGCYFCDGNQRAPHDDQDRLNVFDHYCFGHRWPLSCTPNGGDSDRVMVYKETGR